MGIDGTIDLYLGYLEEIHDYFEYRQDWRHIPLEDHREDFWMLTNGEGPGSLCVWSDEPFTAESIESGKNIFSGPIYTQRHLPKWVYRADKLTLVSVDTQTDGNKFLMIFENCKECVDPAMRQAYREIWGG